MQQKIRRYDIQYNDTQQNRLNCDTRHNNLGISVGYQYAECRYAECRYAECHYAECHYAECHYAEFVAQKMFNLRLIYTCVQFCIRIVHPYQKKK